jgi:hypothetical protein
MKRRTKLKNTPGPRFGDIQSKSLIAFFPPPPKKRQFWGNPPIGVAPKSPLDRGKPPSLQIPPSHLTFHFQPDPNFTATQQHLASFLDLCRTTNSTVTTTANSKQQQQQQCLTRRLSSTTATSTSRERLWRPTSGLTAPGSTSATRP